MSKRKVLVAVALAAALAACGKLGDLLSPSQTQTVIISPAPTPTPTPTPTPSAAGLVRPASVRVGFFGGECPAGIGKTFPSNGLGQVPVGCTGFATATPKAADGTDLTPAQHGPDVAWSLQATAAGVVDVLTVQEPFNRDVKGVAVGPFHLCATVQGVTGCLDGSVI